MKKRCENCEYSRVDFGGNSLICARFPPSVKMLPMTNKITGEYTISVNAALPPVKNDYFCGEFSEKNSQFPEN